MPNVKLFANLRKLAGTKELSITGSTVGAVLNGLSEWKPDAGRIILENGELRPHIVITVNGINITSLEQAVADEDVIAIFPPIAGG